MTRIAQQRAAAAQQVRRKALQPEERFCRILKKPITILVEYPDYHTPFNKGAEGEIYCSNIIPCYQKNIQCRYSGISPLYPDPFEGVPKNVREAQAMFGSPEPEVAEEAEEAEIDLDALARQFGADDDEPEEKKAE